MRFVLFFLLFATPLFSTIAEIDTFEEILAYTHSVEPKNSLVLVDIDDTVLEIRTQLGSHSWCRWLIDYFEKKGMTHWQAIVVENNLSAGINPQLPVQVVDEKAPAIVAKLQKMDFPVLGLTARLTTQVGETMVQLRSCGYQLQHPLWPKEPHWFLTVPQALYHDGVIFSTRWHKKSEALFDFLEFLHFHPTTIFFIDDTLSNLQDLEKACLDAHIDFVGLHFSKSDERAKNFNLQIALVQWNALPKILSDREAGAILDAKKSGK